MVHILHQGQNLIYTISPCSEKSAIFLWYAQGSLLARLEKKTFEEGKEVEEKIKDMKNRLNKKGREKMRYAIPGRIYSDKIDEKAKDSAR